MSEKLPHNLVQEKLKQLHFDWTLNPASDHIQRTFKFDHYYETIAFANSVACVANQHNHHPEMLISHKSLNVDYSTHSANGLSDLDFKCARSIDSLFGKN